MKMRMLVSTGIPGGYAKVGDVIDVEDSVAERWIDFRIAQFANSEPDELTNADVLEVLKDEPDEVKKSPVPKKKKGK